MFGKNQDREFFTDSLNTSEIKSSTSTTATNGRLYPPVDRGKYAYLYVASMFMIETFLWGFASSFGVLLNFYEQDYRNPSYSDPDAKVVLSVVGTINNGIIAAAAPFVSFWIVKVPSIRRRLMYFGAVTCGISLLLSSFASSALHVLFTQGIGYAIGGSMLYFVALSYLPEWFEERRGLANGIIFSGTGLGGAVFPLLLDGLLLKIGPNWTLRIIAALFTIVTLTAVFLIRPRVSTSPSYNESTKESVFSCEKEESPKSRFSFAYFCRCLPAIFWIFVFANFLQSTAFYLPGLYFPTYIHRLGRSPIMGSALVSLLNGASMFSQLTAGVLSDHFSPHLIGMISSVLGGISVLVFWGTLGHHHTAWLFIFSIAYGFTAGMWTSLYFNILKYFALDQESVLPAYGLLSLTRGIGSIVAGPISSVLLPSSSTHPSQSNISSPVSFSKLIWFIGVCLLTNGLIESFLWLYIRLNSNQTTKALQTPTIMTEENQAVGKKTSNLTSQNVFFA